MLWHEQPQGWAWRGLGDRGYGVVRGAHLGENLIQPLQGAMQVDLNPAGGAGDVLTVVLSTPALKRHRHYNYYNYTTAY